MNSFDPVNHSHRRLNPLTNEFVLVSPHRMKRPWLGQQEPQQAENLPQYDPTCYLCPGNARIGGQINPAYDRPYTFENDFAAVLSEPIPASSPTHHLFVTEPLHGACDVLVFHPRHDMTLARLSIQEIQRVVEEWIQIYLQRGSQKGIQYVQIFENKGAMMGCSNPHPHGQVWSTSAIPTIPSIELESLRKYASTTSTFAKAEAAPRGPRGRRCILCDYVYAELHLLAEEESRIVVQNDHWVALVPWWATWPFEILLLPYRRHIPSILHLDSTEKLAFADILNKITKRYDNLFFSSFPYSMGIHQRPVPSTSSSASVEGDDDDVAHLHLHFSPPLLRSASVKKFLVGFEMMAEAQRDLTPEQAAAKLRAASEMHYLDANV